MPRRWKDQWKRSKKKYCDQVLLDLKTQINKITNHPDTKKKSVADWPGVQIFLRQRFPRVDISSVPIYETSPEVMNKTDLAHSAGCFIDAMGLIIVKNRIEMGCGGGKGKFARKMRELTSNKLDVEDVVVHELVHAVSNQVRGVASAKFRWNEYGVGHKFRVAEEEFVYTVCVDYYKDKGMSENEIINSLFLPFCIEDVITDTKQMHSFWKHIDILLYPPKDGYTDQQYRSKIKRLYNTHADFLAPAIINEARNRARNMIELYNEYGVKAVHNNISPDEDVSLRAQTLDLDCDLDF